ncbi:MAG: gamma-glutamyltransferase, partial [Rhizomicrobium sp.]
VVMPGVRAASFLVLPVAVLLAGCSLGQRINSVVNEAVGAPATTAGLAVGDEPYSVKTGTAILSEGGSAADAVTAMFFAMTATYPVAAGLGGGGICLVADPVKGVREFDFLPRAASAGGTVAVPGAARGFYDLQAQFGMLPWQRDVAGGEAFAGTGFPISHDLAIRLAKLAARLRQDPTLAAEFLDANGRPKPEGTIISNPNLSQTLAIIRLGGAAAFYGGAVADEMIRAANANGGRLSLADFSAYRTHTGSPQMIAEGDLRVALPSRQTGAGAFAEVLFAHLAPSADPESAVMAAVRQSLAAYGIASLPADLGATGFAAIDKNGQAAACGVTLNGAFGAGVSAEGVLLAKAPAMPSGIAGAFLFPVIVRNSSGNVVLAGAGAGGPNGTGAIAYALLKLAAGQAVDRASELRSTGAAPAVTANLISCAGGLCVALPDPGGHGLGAGQGQ